MTTDKFDLEFDILSGNGEYEITISDEGAATATIEGNKVTIDLLKRDVSLAVSDKSNQSVSLILMSSAKELIPNSYTLLLPKDKTHTLDIGFGVGEYEIETIKGSSASTIVTEDGYIKVTANTVGNSYFMITDKRGSTAPLTVLVPS